MRTGIAITMIAGGLLLSGTVFAQSSGEQTYQAPGVRIWIGRTPSKQELRAATAEARSEVDTSQASDSDQPDYQREKGKVWIGRTPSRAALRKSLQTQ